MTKALVRKDRLQGAGLDGALPYLLLAPSLLVVMAVLLYPLIDGLRASTKFYRYGKPLRDVGVDNYVQLWSDPQFLNSLMVTVSFVTSAVILETILGFALALFCSREIAGIRFMRTFGGGSVEILGRPLRAFIGLVALDVWEWTPLMFLILLAGLQSLPVEPLEAARVDGAGGWRLFWDHTLPMMRPILAVAIVLRTIDAFGTFDQVFVLTRGGPGEATRLLSIFGYDTAFKFQQTGYAAALFVTMGLIILACAMAAVRLLKKVEAK